MKRGALACFIVGAAALALGIWLALASGTRVMPSYLAAWLFWLALPLGALPLLMAIELIDAPWSLLMAPALRRMLLMAPVAALLIVPVLIRLGRAYPWVAAPPGHGFAAAWLSPGFFIVRAIVYLAIWLALALVFAVPPEARRRGRRPGLAIAGLVVHAVIGTLAAIDWAMTLEPGLASSEFGVLFIVVQAAAALAAALLAGGWSGLPGTIPGAIPGAHPGRVLLVVTIAWVYVNFAQFVTVWSANLPGEIAWYQAREAGIGQGAVWFALATGFVVPFFVLLPARASAHRGAVRAAAALVLVVQALEMLWLVTPAFRHHFAVRPTDVLALVGVGGLVVAGALALGARPPAILTRRDSHG